MEEVIGLLQAEQTSRGIAGPNSDENDPRRKLAETIGYLQKNVSRMDYPRYRTSGLPTTSCLIESQVKEINHRVKGSEKFWDQGAEPLLQLAADHLSETEPLHCFWKRRPSQLPSTRCYHAAA